MPQTIDPYKKLLNNIDLLRPTKTLDQIGDIIGTDKGNVSKLIVKLTKGVNLPLIHTVKKYNLLLEKSLTKEPQGGYLSRQQEHTKDIKDLKITVKNLETKIEKILALLEKDEKTNARKSN